MIINVMFLENVHTVFIKKNEDEAQSWMYSQYIVCQTNQSTHNRELCLIIKIPQLSIDYLSRMAVHIF